MGKDEVELRYSRNGAVDPVATRYAKDAVATAGPNYTVVMLYDRVLDDLAAADAAFEIKDYHLVHLNLVHAQDIVRLLRSSLNYEVWDPAPQLNALYNWFEAQWRQANVKQDRTKIAETVPLVKQLRDAWKVAAEKVAADGSLERIPGSGGFLA